MAKRKHVDDEATETVDLSPTRKKTKQGSSAVDELHTNFRAGLLSDAEREKYQSAYAKSQPYKHGVISSLINDDLLRRVRKEIVDQIHFTEKETDIYKIHQSGDLANLDGLDSDSLKQLPSLLELRNAMYSAPFRDYISSIADAGPLSGKKTDMAINVYTPGSHLLCHDDVIGSRRVSYILYLTDPDNPWQAEWGGALRLYPTRHVKQVKGPKLRTPAPDFSLSIPPAWNQISFFAVQPGESFHDVEEVYHSGDAELDKGRVRMAISGWYHIPQKGEEGYEEDAEEKLATSSSLTQLQTKDAFDVPRTEPTLYAEYSQAAGKSDLKKPEDPDAEMLTTDEIDYLLQFIAPNFLTPDGVSSLRQTFRDESCIRVDNFLSKKFAEAIKTDILNQPKTYDTSATEIEESSSWIVAKPPHKHRYLFMLPENRMSGTDTAPEDANDKTPIKQLLSSYFTSSQFRKWLQLSTGLVLRSYDLKARRFRRGADYQLATSYDAEDPRLELTLGISPEGQWENEDVDEGDKAKSSSTEINNGGYEVWMAPDDDEDEHDVTDVASNSNGTGASDAHAISRSTPKSAVSDPAIYKSSTAAEDGGILFSMAAGWNRLSLVLRDSGTHRFVKYVSRAAGADRWDIIGDWDVDWEKTSDFGEDDDDDDDNDDDETETVRDVQEDSDEDGMPQIQASEDEDEDESNDDTEVEDKIRMSFTGR